jgi:hypothetical protein
MDQIFAETAQDAEVQVDGTGILLALVQQEDLLVADDGGLEGGEERLVGRLSFQRLGRKTVQDFTIDGLGPGRITPDRTDIIYEFVSQHGRTV